MLAYRLLQAQTQPEFQEVPDPHAGPPTVEDIRRDSDLFLEGTRTNEFQELTKAAMKRGFQTRDAEMNLGRMVGELDEETTRTDCKSQPI